MGGTIIVCEQRPRWVPELQRQFIGEDVRIRACPTPRRLPELIAEHPMAVVVLVFDIAPAEFLQFLGRADDQPVVLVIASPATAELEWSVRELGATAFLVDPVPGEDLAALCRRQFRTTKIQS